MLRNIASIEVQGTLPPDVKERMLKNVPTPPRKRQARTPSDELEGSVIKQVTELLNIHPLIAFAVRQNSGAAGRVDERGHVIPIWFYKIIRQRESFRLPDFWGLLTSGRMFALEAKRVGWKAPGDQREREQAAFLNFLKSFGHIGEFVRSAEEAKTALET